MPDRTVIADRERMVRILATSWLTVLSCVTTSSTAAQFDDENQTLKTMFSYGLLDSANAYSQRRQELSSTESDSYARWTMRVMESYAQAELRSTDLASAQWGRCRQTWLDFGKQHPEHRRLPWVTWQLGRCHLLEAQANLAMHLAIPSDETSRQRALSAIREALRLLEALVDDIQQRQPLAARQGLKDGKQAPAQQLAKLLVDCGLLSCEALLIRSRLYPPESADRIAAATDVQSRARSILSRTAADWDTRKPLEIAEAAANLELGRSAEALQKLTEIARGASRNIDAARAAAIAIEFLTDDSQLSRARGLLPLLEGTAEPPAVAIAKLRIQLAELNDNSNISDRDSQLQSLLDQSRLIGQQFGPYWRNRADALLLDQAPSQAAGGAAMELLAVEVRQLLATGDDQAAVARLLQFRDNQAATGEGEAAIDVALKASALLARKQNWTAAATATQAIALQYHELPSAPGAHARSIFMLAQALRENSSDTGLAERYEASLFEHLEYWPEAEETATVQGWLKKWLMGENRAVEYAATLVKRSSQCQQLDTARAVLIEWLETVLNYRLSDSPELMIQELKDREPENSKRENPLYADLVRVIELAAIANTRWPEPDIARSMDAEITRLKDALANEVDIQMLTALELLRLAQQEQLSEARRVATAWQPEMLPESLILRLMPALVEALDELETTAPASWLQTLKISLSLADTLATTDRLDLKASGFRLQIWLGRPEALTKLRQLADDNPRDGQLQLQIATALQSQPNAPSKLLDEAATRLRRIVAGSPPGTSLNLAARWAWIKNLIAHGKRPEAQRAAQLLLASQPLDSEVWKRRFESQR